MKWWLAASTRTCCGRRPAASRPGRGARRWARRQRSPARTTPRRRPGSRSGRRSGRRAAGRFRAQRRRRRRARSSGSSTYTRWSSQWVKTILLPTKAHGRAAVLVDAVAGVPRRGQHLPGRLAGAGAHSATRPPSAGRLSAHQVSPAGQVDPLRATADRGHVGGRDGDVQVPYGAIFTTIEHPSGTLRARACHSPRLAARDVRHGDRRTGETGGRAVPGTWPCPRVEGAMARVIHVFRQPDRFVAGTVGEPGDRTFYLQAAEDVPPGQCRCWRNSRCGARRTDRLAVGRGAAAVRRRGARQPRPTTWSTPNR